MATGKPDVLLLLLTKLLEDGNILYKKNRIKDASTRYQVGERSYEQQKDLSGPYLHSRLLEYRVVA